MVIDGHWWSLMIHLVPGWKLLCRAFLSELLYLLPFGPGRLTDFSSTGVIKGGWENSRNPWRFIDGFFNAWKLKGEFFHPCLMTLADWRLLVGDCNMSQERIRHGCDGQQQGVGDTQSRIDHERTGVPGKGPGPKTDHHHVSIWVDISWSIVHMCQLLRCSCFFMWYVSCYWTIASTFTSFCRWFYRKFLSCCWHIWVLFNFECNTPYVLPQWELVGLDTRSGTFSNLDMLMGQNWGFNGAVEGWSFSGPKKTIRVHDFVMHLVHATSRY